MKKVQNIFENFNDIIPPDPVSMFPSSDGYILILIFLFSTLFPLGIYAYKYHNRNLYRKEALVELEKISHQTAAESQLLYLLELLKRVSIVAYSRKEVAHLTGASWWNFLDSKSSTVMDKPLQDYCDALYLKDTAFSSDKNNEVISYIKRWIKNHKGAKIA